MANNTTTLLSDSIVTKYKAEYTLGAMAATVYDQFATPIGADMSNLARGSSVTVPFLSTLAPSTQTISETADIATVSFRDATVTVSPTSRGNSIVISELFDLQNYLNGTSKMTGQMGQNAAESIDLVAMAIMVGNGINRSVQTTRSSVDAGTAAHRLNSDTFFDASTLARSLQIPQYVTPTGPKRMALVHPMQYRDLFASGSLIQAVGAYQDKGMVLNNEIGTLDGWAITVSPYAKVFLGAGAANGTAVNTTISAAVEALATTMTVASATNISVGQRLMIGTVETSTTYYETNEMLVVTGVNGTTITIAGGGANGGFKYDHASGVAVKNADNVFSAIFGCPESIAKVYNVETGPYGEVIPAERTGSLKQFIGTGWKWYGNYGVISNARWIRVETSSGMDA